MFIWGLGIGDWGLGIGPNPQSPIPNPHYFYYHNINSSLFIIFLLNYKVIILYFHYIIPTIIATPITSIKITTKHLISLKPFTPK